jgi:hypothetical protein
MIPTSSLPLSSLCGLAVAVLALLGSACASRPASEKRFEKNPEIVAKLSSRERDLVRRGEVAEGMSRDAVFIAWGRPDDVRTGSRDGRERERWTYLSRTGGHTTSVGFSTGGYGGLHTGVGYQYGPFVGLGNDPYFPSRVERTVEFVNDRVVSWESRR